MEQTLQTKWEGKVSTRLRKATADQIWPLFKDFFNFHKWFPGLRTCYGVHGTNGEPGCIRYCAGSKEVSSGTSNDDNSPDIWARERLITVDQSQRSLSYEVLENNIGFKSYVATFKVIPSDDDHQDGCMIEWSFTVDPVDGWPLDDLVTSYCRRLQGVAKRMEDTCT